MVKLCCCSKWFVGVETMFHTAFTSGSFLPDFLRPVDLAKAAQSGNEMAILMNSIVRPGRVRSTLKRDAYDFLLQDSGILAMILLENKQLKLELYQKFTLNHPKIALLLYSTI